MKLRNKKTGEIVYATMMASYGGGELQIRYYPVDRAEDTQFKEYRSISELNEEWEDYEEPKEYWCIDWTEVSGIYKTRFEDRFDEFNKSIGNYFSSREEAERAVEKLKAWKRLKDRNLRFNSNYSTGGATINHKDVIMCRIEAYFDDKWEEENMKAEEDLDLLLGGEE